MRRLLIPLIGAALGALALLLTYAARPEITIEMDRPVTAAATGFYGEERLDRDTYAWTGKDATLTLSGLDRRIPWSCTIRLRGARADASTLPEVVVAVDGIIGTRFQTSNDYADVRVTLPVRERGSNTAVTLSVSNTFVPESDRRELGVIVDRWACAPGDGRWARAPLDALAAAAAGGAAFGLAITLTGLATLPALALLAVLAVAQAVPLSWEFAAFSAYPDTAWRLAVALALLLALGTALTTRVLGRPLSRAAQVVACITVVVLYLKLLALLHPSKPIIDAVFHAHRLMWILEGRWFFTQPMPSGVRFPYAIGLYLFAAPWTVFTDNFVTLLRLIITVAEAAGGLLLYRLITKTWEDRTVAAVAAVLFAVVPRTFEIVGNANMTNAFGQSVAFAVLAAAVLWSLGQKQWGQWTALMLLTTFAFLCHISTFMLLGAILLMLAVLYGFMSRGALRRQAWSVATAAVVAGGLAVALYYAHFGDAYRSAARVSAAGPGVADASLAASPFLDKLSDAARLSVAAIGWPIFLLAVVGAVVLWRRGTRDRLTLATLALVGTCVAFTLSVVMAPVEQSFQRYAAEFISRVTLATYPAMVIYAALGMTTAWRAGGIWRPAGAVLLLGAVAVGAQEWMNWIR